MSCLLVLAMLWMWVGGFVVGWTVRARFAFDFKRNPQPQSEPKV